jgi:predicted DsbA family dithiol-disulfide isomerase
LYHKYQVIEYLNSDKDTSSVLQEIKDAQRKQIGGVPFFSINNGEFEVGGAQEPVTFVNIFSKIAARA